MAENQINTRIRAGEQLIFINTGKIVGLQDISITKNFGAGTLSYLGIGNNRFVKIPVAEQSASVSINGYLINNDYLIGMTGSQPANLFILKSQQNINDNYCLLSGYLNTYSSRYSIGAPSQISATMTFYGNVGNVPTGSLDSNSYLQLSQISSNSYTDNISLISNGSSVSLTLDEYSTNRVIDCSVNISTNRVPIYNLGRRRLLLNKLIYPLNVDCSFSFEIAKNYIDDDLLDFPQSPKVQNISISVSDYLNGSGIASYSFSDMTLINESKTINVDGNTIISVSYNGLIGLTSTGNI